MKPTGVNVVAVELFPREKKPRDELGGWNPMPPDKEMGLWSDVRLSTSGGVSLHNPAVFTHFSDDGLNTALLTLTADLDNRGSELQAALTVEIDGRRVSQPVALPAR